MFDILFSKIKTRFIEWLKKKPTGDFIIKINVGEGGIRGKPKITITDDL